MTAPTHEITEQIKQIYRVHGNPIIEIPATLQCPTEHPLEILDFINRLQQSFHTARRYHDGYSSVAQNGMICNDCPKEWVDSLCSTPASRETFNQGFGAGIKACNSILDYWMYHHRDDIKLATEEREKKRAELKEEVKRLQDEIARL